MLVFAASCIRFISAAVAQSGIYVEFYSGGSWAAVPGFPNRLGGQAGPGEWLGTITIGSTTLSHTSGVYTTLPSALGGGAVGLAPFKLHETACTPPHNQVSSPGSIIETTSFEDVDDVPVIITNFGHIRRNPSTTTTWNDAVDIECIAHGSPRGRVHMDRGHPGLRSRPGRCGLDRPAAHRPPAGHVSCPASSASPCGPTACSAWMSRATRRSSR